MFKIDKTFEFCYGHRVWTQVLDGKYADDLKCACRHLHGHEAKVQVYMESPTLNEQGMVTDFRHLEWLKKWFNTYVDHQFLFDVTDPLYEQMMPRDITSLGMTPVYAGPEKVFAAWKLDLFGAILDPYLMEMAEGITIVDFVPTSENLAKWVHEIVSFNMAPLGVSVTQVDWWETPKSRSSYYVPRG